MEAKRHSVCFPVVCGLMIACVFLFAGCSKKQAKGSFTSRGMGIGCDFPDGWSRLSSEEMKRMFPGKEVSIFTIGDRDRVAIVSFVKVPFNREEVQAINCYSNLLRHGAGSGKKSKELTEAEEKLAAFYTVVLMSVQQAMSKRYEGFKLLRRGAAAFGGMLVGEIVCEGSKPGEEKKWRQMVIMLPKDAKDNLLVLGFSVPVKDKQKYSRDFEHIEKTWSWK